MSTRDADQTRDCLLRVGVTLLAGTAAGPDVERLVIEIGQRLGIADTRAAATVTGLFLSATPDHAVVFAPVRGTLRFEQLTLVHGVVDGLLAGRLTPAAAISELAAIEATPPSRPTWISDLAIVPIAVGICTILQPTWRDLGAATLGSLVVVALVIFSRRSPLLATLLPLVAALTVTWLVLQYAQWWPLDGAVRTIVATIAVLLPGAMIVTGLSEIASGAAVSGSSRLVSGAVQLLLFAVGLFAAVALRGDGLAVLTLARSDDLGALAPFIGIIVVGAGMVINVAADWRDMPWVLGVLFLTFVVQYGGQRLWGAALGALAGATVAGLSASVVNRLSGRPLDLVVYLPAFWLLVPGSLGLLSAAEIASGGGMSSISTTTAAMVSIVVGTLVGSTAGRAVDRQLDQRRPSLTPGVRR